MRKSDTPAGDVVSGGGDPLPKWVLSGSGSVCRTSGWSFLAFPILRLRARSGRRESVQEGGAPLFRVASIRFERRGL